MLDCLVSDSFTWSLCLHPQLWREAVMYQCWGLTGSCECASSCQPKSYENFILADS